MRYSIYLLLFLFIWACEAPTDQDRDIPEYSMEQFMNTTSYFGSSFSPEEHRILITSDETGIFNCFSVPVDSGSYKQLTHSDSNYRRAISYFPNDNRILFTSDQGGNELNHIYVRYTDGSIEDLTPDTTAKAEFFGWAADDQSFFYLSNKRDRRYFDIYEIPLIEEEGAQPSMGEPELFYKNEDGLQPGDLSHNKRYLSLSDPVTTSINKLYILDRKTGKRTRISPENPKSQYASAYFGRGDSTFYYRTNSDDEFMYLSAYDISSGTSEKVLEADWDITSAYQSKDGTYRVVSINEDAQTKIRIDNMKTGERVELPEMPDGLISSVNISDSEELMAFYVNSSRSPSNLYVYDFKTKEYQRLTDALNPEIEPDHLVEGEVIRYESFDGLEIPSILYKPKDLEEGTQYPATLWMHGGPGGQSRLDYRAMIQFLVNHDYVVLAVNNRGSSGYGKTFYQMDDRKHGEVDLKDCIWAKKYLAEQDYVDSSDIGIAGGSYGGYLVMAALTFAPDTFDLGVNYFGVTNWNRTLKSIPSWWSSYKNALYQEIGHPEKDSVMLRKKSPLFYADRIKKPFIVLQGSNDPRVIKSESDDIVEAARENGVPVEYVIFEDEGHGFVKKENRIEAGEKVLDFLNKHLRKNE